MKILQVNNCHFKRGGADIVYFNTIEMLQKKGHQVFNFSINDKKNEISEFSKYFVPKKVNVLSSLWNKVQNISSYFKNIEAAKNIEKLILEEKPDIAHIHLFYGGLTPSILKVLKTYKIPVIHSVHDYRIVCPAYTFLNSKGEICESCGSNSYFMAIKNRCSKGSFLQSVVLAMEMYYRNIFFDASKFIDGFIYVSGFAKIKHYQFKPILAKLPALVLFNNSVSAVVNKGANKGYFLFFGRISHEKGVKTLIEVFKELNDFELYIVGTGPEFEFLNDYVVDNKIYNISFLGYKSGSDLMNLISEAYFVIVPSEWYENNPMTIIESYSLGTPVIGSNIGGIPEILIDGKTGFLFESGNKQELKDRICKSKDLKGGEYVNFCNNASEFAKSNFDDEKYYQRLIKFYHEIIEIKNKQ
jgi:glycosyltransferase involved in cell wall biosynthesis